MDDFVMSVVAILFVALVCGICVGQCGKEVPIVYLDEDGIIGFYVEGKVVSVEDDDFKELLAKYDLNPEQFRRRRF